MAQATFNAKKIVRAYGSSLAQNFRVDSILIFGSAARNELRADSDIDCIVLSRNFKDMPLIKRLTFLNSMRSGLSDYVPMDILGFTPGEFASFKTSDSPNLRKVYREAKKVYP